MARTLFEYKVTCNGKTVAGFTTENAAILFAHANSLLGRKNKFEVWTKGSKGNRKLIVTFYGGKEYTA